MNNNITYAKEGVSRKPFNTNNSTTKKIEPPKILVISYDEDSKRFLIYQGNYMFRGPKIQANLQHLYLQKLCDKIQKFNPDLVVCCTQNSLACTEDHFQHYFRELMEKTLRKKEKSMKYSLISKADATTENDSSFWSCSTKISNNSKPYNVRTRIYGNEDTLEANLSEKRISEQSVSGRFNKKSKYDEFYSARSGTIPINKYYVDYIGFRRFTESSTGKGGILYDIMICKRPDINTNPTCYQNIFCNYNLKEPSSKRILDAIAFRPIFEGNKENKDKIKNELQIFMITPDNVKTKKFLVGEAQTIFVNNKKTNINSIKITSMFGKNIGKPEFKRINTSKINNNIYQEEYKAHKKKTNNNSKKTNNNSEKTNNNSKKIIKNKKSLKILKIFNTSNIIKKTSKTNPVKNNPIQQNTQTNPVKNNANPPNTASKNKLVTNIINPTTKNINSSKLFKIIHQTYENM
jgi:hypothetical protein